MSAALTLDEQRKAALARLQASRERLRIEFRPGLHGTPLRFLDRPWRLLRRWWRSAKPAVKAGQWLQASTAEASAVQHAGQAAAAGASRWVRKHPLAGLAIAAVAGALLIHKRAAVWGLALGVGQGVLRQGKGWLLQQISDPALYAGLFTAVMAGRAAAEDEVASESATGAAAPEV